MSEVVGEGVVRIRTDETGVDYDGAGKRAGSGYASGFKSSLKGLAVAVGGALAIGKGIDLLKSSVAEAREAQKVSAATNQIIKATGGVANISAAQVGDLASSLSAKAGVDDELIQSGANLLLTFKNVRNEAGKGADIFDRATAAAVDLSAAGFGSIEGGSKMLGKALNDPVAGISALSRAGVTFTQQQKDQIKTLVDSGKTLEAQKIILGEVEGQVGGVAEATATAGEKASVAWGNVQETIGTLLLPVLDKLAGIFTSVIAPAIQDVLNGTSAITPVLTAIRDVVEKLFASIDPSVLKGIAIAFGVAAAAAGVFAVAMGAVALVTSPITLIVVAIAALGAGIALLWKNSETFRSTVTALGESLRTGLATAFPIIGDVLMNQVIPAVQQFGQSLVTNFGPVLLQIATIIKTQVVPIVLQLGQVFVQDVLPVLASVWQFISTSVVPLLGTLANVIATQIIPPILSLVQVVITKLQPVFAQLAQTIQTRIVPTAQKMVQQIRTQLIPALQPLIQKVIVVISFLVKLAATILGKVLPPLIRLAGFIISRVIPAVVTIITKVAQFVNGLINFVGAVGRAVGAAVRFASTLQTQVNNAVRNVVSAVTGLPGKIIALGGRMLTAGKSLMGKLFDGIKAGASAAGGFISGLAGQLIDAVRNAINSALNLPLEVSFDKGPIHIHATVIPALAKGTDNFAGGLALVGEEGPELVNLPTGSRVTPAAETADALGGGVGDDFWSRLIAALVEALGAVRPVTVLTDAKDPEAVAMQVVNRLAAS